MPDCEIERCEESLYVISGSKCVIAVLRSDENNYIFHSLILFLFIQLYILCLFVCTVAMSASLF